MDPLTQAEISIVLFFQHLGTWLKTPMQAVTFLGSEYFFMVMLPFLYWCIDARLGIQYAAMTVFSNYFSGIFKLIFRLPRPFWVDSRVQAWTTETSFGMPSGHATSSISTWGVLMSHVKKNWAVILMAILVFLIGLSRIYLGVHFLSQVLAGWLLGGMILFLLLRFSEPLLAWFLRFSLPIKIGLIFLAAVLMVVIQSLLSIPLEGVAWPANWITNASNALPGTPFKPVDIEGAFTLAGTWFGGFAGAAWYHHKFGMLNTAGSLWKKALRFLLGVIVLIGMWYGLDQIFPQTADLGAYLLRSVRYAILGLWLTVFAPLIFQKIHLMAKPA